MATTAKLIFQNMYTRQLSKSPYLLGSVTSNALLWNTTRHMAGHSKWANIKKDKAAGDKLKSYNACRMANMIRVAIKDGGGTDPNLNRQLAKQIDFAKQNNVPKATIDNVISKAKKAVDDAKQYTYDFRGPNGVFIVATALTSNIKKTRYDLIFCAKKFGLLDGKGAGVRLFTEKGILIADVEDKTLETAMDHAIEFGAEDVTQEDDTFMFTCEPFDLLKLNNGLEEHNYKISYSNVDYIPNMTAVIAEEQQETTEKAVKVLEEVDEVINVYVNI